MQAPRTYREGTPSWVDLATSDPEEAKTFYGDVFGWEFEDLPTDQGVAYSMARKTGKAVAGVARNTQEGFPPAWSTYLSVNDCDGCTSRARDAGGQVMVEPTDVMDAGRMSFVVDTTGAPVGLWQPGTHIGAEVIDEPGAYTWAELMTSDADAAAAFYSETVGLDTNTQDFGGSPYTMFTAADRVVGGMLPPPMAAVPNHWHVYFGTADTDATVAAVEAAGGSVKAASFDTPVGRMATVADPHGATFSVICLNEWPE